MSDLIIRQLFDSRLKAWSEDRDQPLPIQFQNEDFTPPNSEAKEQNSYLRAFLLPATTISEDLAGDHAGFSGIYQISVVTARGIGAGPAGLITDALFDLFPNNLPLIADSGLKVQIVTPLRVRTGINGDTDYTVPTDFAYRADRF